MAPSRIRSKINSGDVIFCSKSSYHNPEVVELMGRLGFDGIWICLEHKKADPSLVYSLIQACRLGQTDAVVRVKPSNYTDLLWLLEAGVRGLMLPRVRGVEEVRDLVAAMKFPPVGNRGFDGVGVEADFGLVPAADYIAQANRENVLMVQIEEAEVIPQIEIIAKTPGVDVLFVGPADLTLSLGKPWQTDDPEVVEILRHVAEVCRRHGKVAGLPCPPDRVRFYHDMGYRFFNVATEYRCVLSGLRQAKSGLEAAGFTLAR